ncbi:hypothetical protein D3C78_1140720 [compost metagenome]
MVLADLRGGVAVLPEDFGDGAGAPRQDAGVAVVADAQFRDHAEVGLVLVAPGEQRGAGRRAQRAGVEAIETHAVGGQPVQAWRSHPAAEDVELAEADVVEQDHQHVRRTFWWSVERRELRRIAVELGAPDIPRKVVIRFRQNRLGMRLDSQCAKSQQPAQGARFLLCEHTCSSFGASGLAAEFAGYGCCCFGRAPSSAAERALRRARRPGLVDHCAVDGFCRPMSALRIARLW